MSKQHEVEKLAARFEEANEAALAVARNCTEEQWQTMVPEEQCTVGVLFRHLAWPTPHMMWYAKTAAAGKELPISPAAADRAQKINADHAEKYANVTKEQVIQLLEDTCADALAQLRQFSDEQLDITMPWQQPYEPVPEQDIASARLIVEWNLIYHRYDHLEQIKTVLGID